MKVVILCGGQGTRIRDVANNIPKPMVSIGDFPILWHIMKNYATYGFKEFILCLGYKGHVIKDFFLNYEASINDFTITLGNSNLIDFHNNNDESDWKVTLAETGLDALTGTRIKRIKKYIGSDDVFMLTYGDGLGDVDLGRLIQFHHEHGKIMTVTGVRPPGRFGELECGSDGAVKEFNEKPQATGGRISGGFFVCSSGVFDYIPDDKNLMLEEEPMRHLQRDQQFMAYEHDGFWQCMDTYRDYRLLSRLWDEGNAPWKTW